MPSPGVPSFMPSTSLSSGLMPPNSQPGAPVPMYQGGIPSQGPAHPVTSGPYTPLTPLGSGYPQGGPGAPAVKPFPAPVVAPPPTGAVHASHDTVITSVILIYFKIRDRSQHIAADKMFSCHSFFDLQDTFRG